MAAVFEHLKIGMRRAALIRGQVLLVLISLAMANWGCGGASSTPETSYVPTIDDTFETQPPAARGDLPKFGEYVYVEELPKPTKKVPPRYPSGAIDSGIDGTVLVQALVGEDGRIKDTRVVKSIPALDAAAVAAVRQWKFKPALLKGKPVAVWVVVPVRFTLN